MEILENIILYTEKQNKVTKKNISYALVSNLTMIDEKMLDKLMSFPNLSISTSLDGDKKVHDFNRLLISDRKTLSSFDTLSQKIKFIREKEKEV
jgi:sulfatase maturation enzyme AslB (radical SAM superfamily)